MTNYESIDPKDIRTVFQKYFAIDKDANEIKNCRDVICANCLFYMSDDCMKAKKEWLDRPVIDPEKDIDWSKVPVDTPVIVWNTDSEQYRRYFSGIKNECFGAYADGRTSWSSITGQICYWHHCKLYRLEDVEKYRKKETWNE